MEEKSDDLVEGVKRIGDGARRFSKETLHKIAAAVAVVAALGWNEGMKALFAKFFSTETTIAMLLLYAVLVTILAVFFEKWAKKEDEQPAGLG